MHKIPLSWSSAAMHLVTMFWAAGKRHRHASTTQGTGGQEGGHFPARKWLWRWAMGLGPGLKHWHNPPERLSPGCCCLSVRASAWESQAGGGWPGAGGAHGLPSLGTVHSRASPAPPLAPHLAGTVRVHGGLQHAEAQPNGAQFGGDVDDRGPAAAQPLLPRILRCLLQERQKLLAQRHRGFVNT